MTQRVGEPRRGQWANLEIINSCYHRWARGTAGTGVASVIVAVYSRPSLICGLLWLRKCEQKWSPLTNIWQHKVCPTVRQHWAWSQEICIRFLAWPLTTYHPWPITGLYLEAISSQGECSQWWIYADGSMSLHPSIYTRDQPYNNSPLKKTFLSLDEVLYFPYALIKHCLGPGTYSPSEWVFFSFHEIMQCKSYSFQFFLNSF